MVTTPAPWGEGVGSNILLSDPNTLNMLSARALNLCSSFGIEAKFRINVHEVLETTNPHAFLTLLDTNLNSLQTYDTAQNYRILHSCSAFVPN
jgi:hypothetical protein